MWKVCVCVCPFSIWRRDWGGLLEWHSPYLKPTSGRKALIEIHGSAPIALWCELTQPVSGGFQLKMAFSSTLVVLVVHKCVSVCAPCWIHSSTHTSFNVRNWRTIHFCPAWIYLLRILKILGILNTFCTESLLSWWHKKFENHRLSKF